MINLSREEIVSKYPWVYLIWPVTLDSNDKLSRMDECWFEAVNANGPC